MPMTLLPSAKPTGLCLRICCSVLQCVAVWQIGQRDDSRVAKPIGLYAKQSQEVSLSLIDDESLMNVLSMSSHLLT